LLITPTLADFSCRCQDAEPVCRQAGGVEALPLFLLVLKLFKAYHANVSNILAEIFWLFLLNELTCAAN
jgi:hypothetical protein